MLMKSTGSIECHQTLSSRVGSRHCSWALQHNLVASFVLVSEATSNVLLLVSDIGKQFTKYYNMPKYAKLRAMSFKSFHECVFQYLTQKCTYQPQAYT